MVAIKSFSLNNISSVLITKLETNRGKYKRNRVQREKGSDSNLMPISTFKIIQFLDNNETAKFEDKSAIFMNIYQNTHTPVGSMQHYN